MRFDVLTLFPELIQSHLDFSIMKRASEDGVIEAIEYPGDYFNIGIQWHPEISYEFDENSRKIIDEFLRRCNYG